MATGTRRHGMNAAIFMDVTAPGTLAVTTAALTKITSKGVWSFDQSRDFVDVTAFQDTSKSVVAGLAGSSGAFSGELDFADTGSQNWSVACLSSTERGFIIIPDVVNNAGLYISGKAFFSAKAGGSVTTAVTQEITFEAGPTGLSWTIA